MKVMKANKKERKYWKLYLLPLLAIGMCVSSCLEEVANEFRVTAGAFATVTHDDAGNVCLYLDEGRGIVTPSSESDPVEWGNAVRVYLNYDLPVYRDLPVSMEDEHFTTIVRGPVHRIDTIKMTDVAGLDKLPSILGSDTLEGYYSFDAYRGFVTARVTSKSLRRYDLRLSYDSEKFGGDTLYLRLHCAERNEAWNGGFVYQPVSAEIPEFLRQPGVVSADSLLIVMTTPIWFNGGHDSAYIDTTSFWIQNHRLTPPIY